MGDLARTNLAAIASRGLAASVSVAFFLVVAWWLGARETGYYLIAHSAVQFAGLVGRLGCEPVLIRRVASEPRGLHEGARLHWPPISLTTLYGSLTGCVLVLGSTWVGATQGWLDESTASCLYRVAPSALPATYVAMRGELFKAVGRSNISQWVQSALIPGVALVVWGGCQLSLGVSGVPASGTQISLLYTAAASVSALGLAWVLPVSNGLRPMRRIDRMALREGRPILMAAGARYLVPWIPLWTLGAIGNVEAAGVYAIAIRVVLLLELMIVAINGVVAPRLAYLASSGLHWEIRRTIRGTQRLVTLLGAPFVLLAILRPELLLALLGSEYLAAASVLPLLAAAQFVQLWSGPCGPVMTMTSHGARLRACVLIGGGISLASSLIFIPRLELTGAAIAAAAATVSMSTAILRQARRTLDEARARTDHSDATGGDTGVAPPLEGLQSATLEVTGPVAERDDVRSCNAHRLRSRSRASMVLVRSRARSLQSSWP